MAESRKLHVFLCHASQDKPVVRELYQRLLAEDWIDPWLDEDKLLPGYDWDMEIEKAVEAADVVLVCLSNQSMNKEGYVQRELRFALDIALQKPEGTIFIIPMKLEDCEPPRRLRTWQYVEYFPADKRETSFSRVKISMQERWKRLGLSVSLNDLENLISQEPLSSRIIAKKLSDARQALQDDQLQLALGIYDALAKQKFRLNDIIHDLEDVSIVYSDSKELWGVLATAYRMNGDIGHAQEFENKINPPPTPSGDAWRKTEAKAYSEEQKDSGERAQQDHKQPASATLFLPSTISIETAGGISTPILYKGDLLPAQVRDTFSTASDNQSQVEMHLVLGENKLANDNESLGKFILDGIPSAPKGAPQIEILCEVNRELELNVTATDKTSGQKKNFQTLKLNTIAPPLTIDPLPPRPDLNSKRSSDFNWDQYGGLPGGQIVEYSELDELFGGASGFSDFFRTIFGRQAQSGSAGTSTPQQPQGYQQELEITFEEAYKGTTRSIKVVSAQKRIRIPAGLRTGSKVRVAGAGPNGLDLYLIISVSPHPFFMRNGIDILLHYPIPKTLAQNGGQLQMPLLEKGKSIFVAIPPNTKDKQVFKFANRGFPKVKMPTEFGDFYLTVDLYDPLNTPQESKKLLEDINKYMQ